VEAPPVVSPTAPPDEGYWGHLPLAARQADGSPRWYGESATPWGEVLDRTAELYPGKEAILSGEAITYREFQELANGLARGLLGLGVRPGDAIALWLSPRPEALIAQFACYKLGVPLVPIDPAQRDLGEVLSQSDATALFLTEALPGLASPLETVYELLPELVEAPPGKLLSDRFPRLRHIVLLRGSRRFKGIFSLEELYTRGEGVGEEELEEIASLVGPEAVQHLLYAYGRPGAMLTQRASAAAGGLLADLLRLGPEDRVLLAFPPSHPLWLYPALAAVWAGACLVPSQAFPSQAVEALERDRVSVVFADPGMFRVMVGQAGFRPPSLRLAVAYGAPLEPGVRKRLGDAGTREVVNLYGREEAGLVTATARGEGEGVLDASVGRPLPHCQVKVIDPATGRELPAGETGAICSRGVFPGVHGTKGYYKKPRETAAVLDAQGWLHGPDLGFLDGAGYLHITGRKEGK